MGQDKEKHYCACIDGQKVKGLPCNCSYEDKCLTEMPPPEQWDRLTDEEMERMPKPDFESEETITEEKAWEDYAKHPTVGGARHDFKAGYEAGVKAERERISVALEELAADAWTLSANIYDVREGISPAQTDEEDQI